MNRKTSKTIQRSMNNGPCVLHMIMSLSTSHLLFENFHFCSHLLMSALQFRFSQTILRKWRTLDFQGILKSLGYKISTPLNWELPHLMNSSMIIRIISNAPPQERTPFWCPFYDWITFLPSHFLAYDFFFFQNLSFLHDDAYVIQLSLLLRRASDTDVRDVLLHQANHEKKTCQ